MTKANTVPEPVPETADERTAKQQDWWGKYVAAGPIDIGNARAFNEGHPVPIGHVEGHMRDVTEDDGKGNRVVVRQEFVEPVVRLDQVRLVEKKG